ncbi:MAG: hypothetical protein ACI8V2_005186 [Candidatus Latescibacterota bacterium]|jgi:hypothetical protein
MNHPFLICQKSEYDALRNRASQSPYKDFIEEARRVVKTLQYEPDTNVGAQGTRIRDLMGALALLYVIEPDHRETHRQRITNILDQWPQFTTDVTTRWDAGGNRWSATVPPSSGFFNTVLALDIIHDDLSASDLSRYETSLQEMVDWFWETMRGWGMATFGPRAVWAAYKNEDRLEEAMQQYRDAIFEQMTPDGVGRNGPEYSHARLNGERTAKYGFMHVAEYTGLDKSFYKDFRLKWYYEWLFSSGCTPFNTFVTFGDSGHGRGFNTFYPQSGAWAAGKFSSLAAQYASNRVASAHPRYPSDLLVYCIAEPLPEKRTPQSRLWNDGGALFYEKNDTEDALLGALWNVSTPSHGHRDANAIYLAGYGEHLLINSGYNGYGNASKGFPWTYINDTAESSNTLLINNQNHLEKGADGLIEGLVTEGINYASGLADRAFEGDTQHNRALIFIPPQNNAPGYYLLIDTVENTDHPINLVLHPASANVEITRPNEEYTWNVKSRKETDTFLTLYLGTEPQTVELKDGALAGWGKCFVGKYLYATYQNAPIITVLFPHDATHPKAEMTRTENSVTIHHTQNIIDMATHNSLLRQIDHQHEFYFAKQKTHYQDGDIGFTTNEPITLFMRGKTGHIVSPGTEVIFHHPNVSRIKIDGETFVSEPTSNGIRVTVPQGTCKIELG